MDWMLMLVVIALVLVLLLPKIGEAYNFSGTLDDMGRKAALRYGLDFDVIQRHTFQAVLWTTSLFEHVECPICLQKKRFSWSLLLNPSGRKCG